MERVIKAGKGLSCGCCGTFFYTWKGYKDQDQDDGYGICKECQGDIQDHEEAEFDKAIETLKTGLNPEQRKTFETWDRDLQKGFVMKAIEDGVLQFKVVRA